MAGQSQYELKRILIWGKTYPELSTKYIETVCTGGVLEDGSPIRLYPIPFRYLDDAESKFKKYQWITVPIAKSNDPRPESYKIQYENLQIGGVISTDGDEWAERASIMFQKKDWQFDSMKDLLAAQKVNKISIGAVTPKEIVKVSVVNRSKEAAKSFEAKLESLRKDVDVDQAQLKLFEDFTPKEMKGLEFLKSRISIVWRCHDKDCNSHDMNVLDWEVAELHRREGDEKVMAKVESVCDLETYALKFFVGNMFLHPQSFSIVGLWYPKRSKQGRLF